MLPILSPSNLGEKKTLYENDGEACKKGRGYIKLWLKANVGQIFWNKAAKQNQKRLAE